MPPAGQHHGAFGRTAPLDGWPRRDRSAGNGGRWSSRTREGVSDRLSNRHFPERQVRVRSPTESVGNLPLRAPERNMTWCLGQTMIFRPLGTDEVDPRLRTSRSAVKTLVGAQCPAPPLPRAQTTDGETYPGRIGPPGRYNQGTRAGISGTQVPLIWPSRIWVSGSCARRLAPAVWPPPSGQCRLASAV